MDALALLCNLHGDGPVTLAALRDVGCEDLIGLEALGPQLLGELLGREEAAALRFRREARVLRERIEGEAAVIEPQPPPAPDPHAGLEVVPRSPTLDTPAADVVGDEPQGSGPVVSAVLELWQRLDTGEGPPLASNVLAEVQLSGLKPEDVVALGRAGVRTLEELAEAELLPLAHRSELPYTHLAHMAFLARKMRGAVEPKSLAGTARPDSHDSEAGVGRTSEGSAGPFA
jgi:hypothetical protein